MLRAGPGILRGLFALRLLGYASREARADESGPQLGSALMAKATARHILVDDEKLCEELKTKILDGLDFAEAAREHSTCSSARRGGDLGSFGPGQMVKEFDEVVFSADLNELLGPIKTQFGYHLLEVMSRTD